MDNSLKVRQLADEVDSISKLLSVISLCIENPVITRVSLGEEAVFDKKGAMETFKSYEIVLKWGPFNEFEIAAKRLYFRFLTEDETVKMILNLCSREKSGYSFDLKTRKFKKEILYW